MIGLTRALAKEPSAKNVTVNTVAPGSIATARGFAVGGNTGRAHLPATPVRRRSKPEEIASMVRLLCSDQTRIITGQTIHVNGGAFRS